MLRGQRSQSKVQRRLDAKYRVSTIESPKSKFQCPQSKVQRRLDARYRISTSQRPMSNV
jgi:hypothetical protein